MIQYHGPLSNNWFIVSVLGLIFSYPVWQTSETWGFTLFLFFLITTIATYVSGMRAPLIKEFDKELAVHEKYKNGRYPDTSLHEGMLYEEKIELHGKKRAMILAKEKERTKKIKGKNTKKKSGNKIIKNKKLVMKKKPVTKKKSTRKTAKKNKN